MHSKMLWDENIQNLRPQKSLNAIILMIKIQTPCTVNATIQEKVKLIKTSLNMLHKVSVRLKIGLAKENASFQWVLEKMLIKIYQVKSEKCW